MKAVSEHVHKGQTGFGSSTFFHVPTGRRVELGRSHAPPGYHGPLRCGLHPRSSRSGTLICFDSTHEGLGRQLYLLV